MTDRYFARKISASMCGAIVIVFSIGNVIAQQPVNRLGAHFDQTPNPRQHQLEQFQQAVADNGGTYYSSTRTAFGETGAFPLNAPENNPGLPLNSPGQREFENSRVNSQAAGNTKQPTARSESAAYRNVAYDPPQQDNTLGGGGFSLSPRSDGSQTGQASGVSGPIDLEPCKVEFIDDIDLPAQEAGQIKQLHVREGEPVSAGKIVGQIDDELYMRMLQQAQFRMNIAQQKATDQTSLMAAKNEIDLQRVIYNRTRDLAARGNAPESELDEAMFRYKLAELKLKAAQNEIDAANGEAKVEMARMKEVEEHIRRHTLSVNFNGNVIEIFKHPLEWVDAGQPVMRIARMDRLYVNGVANTDQVNPYELVNRPVTVKLKLAGGETDTFEGKIVNVGMERESGNLIKVKAEIENRPIQGHWVLQPNTTVSMRIHMDQPDSDTAADQTIQPQR